MDLLSLLRFPLPTKAAPNNQSVMASAIQYWSHLPAVPIARIPAGTMWGPVLYTLNPGQGTNTSQAQVAVQFSVGSPRYAAAYVLPKNSTTPGIQLMGPTPTSTQLGPIGGTMPTFFLVGSSGSATTSATRRSVRGLGDATGDVAAFSSSVSAGDQYLGAREYDSAIGAYQAGASALLTQAQADGLDVAGLQALNTTLQAIESKHAGGGGAADTQAAADASNAYSIAHQMLTTASTPGGYAPVVNVPPASSGWQLPFGGALAVLAGVAVGAGAVMFWPHTSKRMLRGASESMEEAKRFHKRLRPRTRR